MFQTNEDIKTFMMKLENELEEADEKKECRWFSNINYTTCTEYYGELRAFLKRLNDSVLLAKGLDRPVNELIRTLESVLTN